MNHAGTGLLAAAVADQQVAAGHPLQHEGEVFAAGQHGAVGHHLVGAEVGLGHGQGLRGFAGAVDQHGIAAAPVDVGPHPEALGLAVNQAADALLQQHTHLGVQRTHAQLQPGGGGYHVVGLPGMHRTHGDHRRLQGVGVARHHGLQGHDDGRCGHHRVGGPVRHGPVPAHAVQGDGGVIGRGHHGASPEDQLPLGVAGHVVHGKNCIARKLLEQAVLHHLQGTATAFFGGLEDEVQRAVKAAFFRQALRGGQQHGGVAVVAAGVHHAVVAAAPVGPGGFVDGQRIHVGPQPQPLARCAAHQLADHARATQAGGHAIAPAAQLLGHQRTGAVFGKGQFGVAVDVAPQVDEGLEGVAGVVSQNELHCQKVTRSAAENPCFQNGSGVDMNYGACYVLACTKSNALIAHNQ